MPNTEPVRVTIFNQTYSLVASEEPGRIEHLAERVDDLMSSIAVRAGNIDATRAAVLACLHLADELESIERRLAALRVAGRRHHPGRLMQQQINPGRREAHRLAIHLHLICLRHEDSAGDR